MPMTLHDKELVAVAISVAAGCRPCTTYHLAEARRQNVSDATIEAAITCAIDVRSRAAEGMRRHAQGLTSEDNSGCGCQSTQPLDELIALGAALAVNCAENTAKHLAGAQRLGVQQDHLDETVALVRMIRGQAVKHAEARITEAGVAPQQCAPVPSACC